MSSPVGGKWAFRTIELLMPHCSVDQPALIIQPTCSAVFQAGGLIVVVIEVTRKSYLASLVPVIVDAILNAHQVVADIVAFVPRGDFPRSRLGEKQRGKILASWVTRRLRTIAQFSIRDPDNKVNQFADIPRHRSSRASKPGSIMANSTRRSTLVHDSEPRSPAPVPEEMSSGATHGETIPQSAPFNEFNEFNQTTPPYPDGAPRVVEPPQGQDFLPPMNESEHASMSRLSFGFDETPSSLTPEHPSGMRTPSYGSEFPQAGPQLDSLSQRPSSNESSRNLSVANTMTSRSSVHGQAI